MSMPAKLTSQLQWRRATVQDAARIATLVNSAYRGDSGREGWTTEADIIDGQRTDAAMVAEELGKPGSDILLVTESSSPETLSGCVLLRREDDACYLGMLTVSPKAQKLGIGSYLMETAESFARNEMGVDRIFFGVIWTRTELISWYERRGYRKTGATKPFPYGNAALGLPVRDDLHFVIFDKELSEPSRHRRAAEPRP